MSANLCVDWAGEEEDVEEGGVGEVTQAGDAGQGDGLEPTGGETKRGHLHVRQRMTQKTKYMYRMAGNIGGIYIRHFLVFEDLGI